MPFPRAILHLDVDSFEFQVWAKELSSPLLRSSMPAVCVNHDDRIVAVNAFAKRAGVTRNPPNQQKGETTLAAALRLCPILQVIKTGTRHGRSDSFTPMVISDKILDKVKDFKEENCPNAVVQRPSKDEVLFDVTSDVCWRFHHDLKEMKKNRSDGYDTVPDDLNYEIQELTEHVKCRTAPGFLGNEYVTALENDEGQISGDDLDWHFRDLLQKVRRNRCSRELSLLYASLVALKLQDWLYTEMDYIVSVGVAENKLLAKLACNLNKPESVTVLTQAGFKRLSEEKLTLTKLHGFGGETGERLQKEVDYFYQQNEVTIFQVLKIPDRKLKQICRRVANPRKPGRDWESIYEELLEKLEGNDDDPVEDDTERNSVSASASFKGDRTLDDYKDFVHSLCSDFKERVMYTKIYTNMTVSFMTSRSSPDFFSYSADGGNGTNQLEIDKRTDVEQMKRFVHKFTKKQKLNLKDIAKVKLQCRRDADDEE